ncbi:hypothetical protein EI613_16405 [Azospirillum sp. 412522]|nr:hypothetical protein [Azospirillum sp. 412522]MBY6263482.1 hypothetical protein [Azospirillum sp. 412522]
MSTSSIGSQTPIEGLHGVNRHRHAGKTDRTESFGLDKASGSSPVETAAAQGADGKDEPFSDTLSVEMPNGFKVSGTHLGGGSAFSAQLLGSMEDMIGFLNGFKPAGGESGTGIGSGASGVGSAVAGAGGGFAFRSLDTFHTDLGNGESVTLHYGTEKDGGNTDASAADAMAQAMQQIVSRYKSHSQPDLADLYAQLGSPTAKA